MEMLFEARNVLGHLPLEHQPPSIASLIEETHPFLSRAGVPSGRNGPAVTSKCSSMRASMAVNVVPPKRCTAELGRLPGRRGAWLRMRFGPE
jgi:hypothetical protein